MPLVTACAACSTKVKVKDELIGKSIKCPKCQNVFKAVAEEEAAPTVKPAVASRPPAKKPAAWDDGDEDDADEKASPWNQKSNGKKAPTKKLASDDEETPKGKGKPPAKKKTDDADDDDDEAPADVEFDALLDQTVLSLDTKKMIQSDLGLREEGVWVGQPDVKMATVTGIGHAIGAAFVVTVLCIILGAGGGAALETWWIAAVAGALWLVLVPTVALLVIYMGRRKAMATAYVITNKRCIVYTGRWFGGPSKESFYPNLLVNMRRMSSWFFGADAGSLVFRSVTTITTTHSRRHGTSTSVSTTYYGFLSIRNLDAVERLIRQNLLTDDDDDDDHDDDRRKKKKKKKR